MSESFNRLLFDYLSVVHGLKLSKLLELVHTQFSQNAYVPELKNIRVAQVKNIEPLHYLLISGTKDNFQTRNCVIEGYISNKTYVSNKTNFRDIDSISINIIGYVLNEDQGCCVPGVTSVEVHDVSEYGHTFFLIDPNKPLDDYITKILNIQ